MWFSMFQKILLIDLTLVLLIGFPLKSFATGDSTKIGISVFIKVKQRCNYTLDQFHPISTTDINETALLDCDMNNGKLQQYAEQTNSLVSTSSNSDNHLRVYMVVH